MADIKLCDACGHSIDKSFKYYEYAFCDFVIQPHKGPALRMDICNDCADKIISFAKKIKYIDEEERKE